MSTTAVEAATWPTEHDFYRAIALLERGVEALEAQAIAYSRLIDPRYAPALKDGAPIPTAADVGVLSVMLSHAELELVALTQHVKALREYAGAAPLEIGVPMSGRADAA